MDKDPILRHKEESCVASEPGRQQLRNPTRPASARQVQGLELTNHGGRFKFVICGGSLHARDEGRRVAAARAAIS